MIIFILIQKKSKIFPFSGRVLTLYCWVKIMSTNFNIDKEIVPITNDLYNKIGKQVANRNTLEYNGDAVKQLVIGAIVYDIAKDELIVLKCLGERFAGKFTMIQGHMAVDKKDTER